MPYLRSTQLHLIYFISHAVNKAGKQICWQYSALSNAA